MSSVREEKKTGVGGMRGGDCFDLFHGGGWGVSAEGHTLEHMVK